MNEECNVDVLNLEHYAPEDFEQCICQKESGTNVFYVLFLRFLDFYFLALNVWGIVYSLTPPRKPYFIYFDFWTIVLYNVLSVFHLHGVGRNWRVIDGYYDDEYLDYMPWDYKLHWVLYSTFLPAQLLSFVVFWVELYTSKTPVYQIVLNVISCALVIFHFCLIAFPLRMMHYFYFVIFYTVYILFTVIYQETAKGGINKSTPIYKNLDWKSPGRAVLIAFAGCAIGVGLYMLFCFLSMVKLWCRDKYDSTARNRSEKDNLSNISLLEEMYLASEAKSVTVNVELQVELRRPAEERPSSGEPFTEMLWQGHQLLCKPSLIFCWKFVGIDGR